ncbi:DNA-binding protein, partial [Acidianus sp. RZ1]
MYCEDCFEELDEYVTLRSPYIDSFTTIYYDDEGNKLDKPVSIAIIRFEGVKGGLLAYVEGEANQNKNVEIISYDIPLKVKVV